LLSAIREKDQKRFLYTVETSPSYGKYHYDGHRACNISLSPEEARKLGNRCPVCKRQLTIGVLHRVEQLADRPEGFVPKGVIPFKSLIPLTEIISARMGIEQLYSKRIWAIYNDLIKAFGSEFAVLLDAELHELKKVVDEKLARAIVDVRDGKVEIKPGYDGVYGYPVFEGADRNRLERKAEKGLGGLPSGQKRLGEF
jgi:PHP family Zn ribbon phosphoesterase